MKALKTLTLLCCLSGPALAETPLTAEEFDALVTGRVLSFGTVGNPGYGVEWYMPNREVLWSRGDGQCVQGKWFPKDGDICFRYENDPEDKCWAIYKTENGIRAVFTTRPNTTVIFEAEAGTVPLNCANFGS